MESYLESADRTSDCHQFQPRVTAVFHQLELMLLTFANRSFHHCETKHCMLGIHFQRESLASKAHDLEASERRGIRAVNISTLSQQPQCSPGDVSNLLIRQALVQSFTNSLGAHHDTSPPSALTRSHETAGPLQSRRGLSGPFIDKFAACNLMASSPIFVHCRWFGASAISEGNGSPQLG